MSIRIVRNLKIMMVYKFIILEKNSTKIMIINNAEIRLNSNKYWFTYRMRVIVTFFATVTLALEGSKME